MCYRIKYNKKINGNIPIILPTAKKCQIFTTIQLFFTTIEF